MFPVIKFPSTVTFPTTCKLATFAVPVDNISVVVIFPANTLPEISNATDGVALLMPIRPFTTSTNNTGVSAIVSVIARLAPSLSRLSFNICPAILLIAINFFPYGVFSWLTGTMNYVDRQVVWRRTGKRNVITAVDGIVCGGYLINTSHKHDNLLC